MLLTTQVAFGTTCTIININEANASSLALLMFWV
jgi:hypothetical protein